MVLVTNKPDGSGVLQQMFPWNGIRLMFFTFDGDKPTWSCLFRSGSHGRCFDRVENDCPFSMPTNRDLNSVDDNLRKNVCFVAEVSME